MAQSVPSTSGLTIVIPQKLKDAMGSEAGNVLVDSYQLAPHPLDGAEYCAFDLKPAYVNGGQEKVRSVPPGSGSESLARLEKSYASTLARAEEKTGKKGEDALAAYFGPISRGYSSKSAFVNDVAGLWFDGYHFKDEFLITNKDTSATYAELLDNMREYAKKVVPDETKAPSQHPELDSIANQVLGMTSTVKPMAELPAAPTSSGVYVAEDGQQLTVVTGCSVSEFVDDDDVSLKFPLGQTDSLATAYVTVMKNGTLTVRKGEVDGYKLDSTGEWIKD